MRLTGTFELEIKESRVYLVLDSTPDKSTLETIEPVKLHRSLGFPRAIVTLNVPHATRTYRATWSNTGSDLLPAWALLPSIG